MSPQIVALGGHLQPAGPMSRFLLGLAGSKRPRVCCLPTATGDSAERIVAFYESFPTATCEPSHLELFGEGAVTDSFGPRLTPLRDGLGFLPGSFCPHYDVEPERRPTYQRLVAEGLPPGIAADDGVGVHFVGAKLADVVTERPGADAYRVEPAAAGVREIPLRARVLPSVEEGT